MATVRFFPSSEGSSANYLNSMSAMNSISTGDAHKTLVPPLENLAKKASLLPGRPANSAAAQILLSCADTVKNIINGDLVPERKKSAELDARSSAQLDEQSSVEPDENSTPSLRN